jgi:hypothetical protein
MYDNEPENVPAPDPDPRIVAMHRVVDLEQQCYEAQHEADRRAKQAAIVQDELSRAREELHNLLGFDSSQGRKTPAMSREDVQAEMKRYAR